MKGTKNMKTFEVPEVQINELITENVTEGGGDVISTTNPGEDV